MKVSENRSSSSPALYSPTANQHGHRLLKGVKSTGCKELALHRNSVLCYSGSRKGFSPHWKDRKAALLHTCPTVQGRKESR